MEVNRYHFYLSSSKRMGGSIEDYDVVLKRPLLLASPHHYFKVIIKQATIPYTFRQVDTGYNQIQYRLIRNTIDYGLRTLSITNGNYNINTLITEVKSQIVSDIGSYLPSYTPTLNWTYNRDTMLITFSFTADMTMTSFTLYAQTNQVATMLGVGQTITFSSIGGVATSAYSTQPVNVSPITSIYIRSGTLKQSDLSRENLVNQDDTCDVLVQIPLYNQPTSWIQYSNELTIENRVLNTIVNDLNLYLTDNRSYALNLRGIDWSCLMTVIEMAPSQDDAHSQIRQDLRFNKQDIGEAMKQVELKSGFPEVEEQKDKKYDLPGLDVPILNISRL